MHPLLASDLRTLPSVLDSAHAIAAEFLASLEARPAAAPIDAQAIDPADRALRETGIGAEAALAAFWHRYRHGISGSAGPRYFGFVTGGATPAALAADWLVSAFDQNATSTQDALAPALERATVEKLRELLALPATMSGSFVTGATMANLVGLALGREWLGRQRGIDVAQAGVAALGPVRVLSGAAHSSIVKAASMLGLGRDACVQVATLPDSEAVDPAALAVELAREPSAPTIVVANAGTVNTVAFDDLPAIVALRERHGFWLHVDAAFGGVAACSAAWRHLLAGWESADSITVDAHKWLNVPYDSAIQFTRHLALQVAVFQNHSAYLPPPAAHADNYLHLTPENSRRWRALPVWIALQAYGRAGLAEVVERNVALARRLGARLDAHPAFELVAPVGLNVVCFALVGGDAAEPAATRRNAFLQRLAADGTTLCTPTILHGRPAIRAALVNWRTTAADIDQAFAALVRALPAR